MHKHPLARLDRDEELRQRLLAAEMDGRICSTMDIDPIFCEIAIRRLERFKQTARTGWQSSNPFAREMGQSGDNNE